jgi:hypothetical protein
MTTPSRLDRRLDKAARESALVARIAETRACERTPAPRSAIMRSAALFDALGGDSTAAPRLGTRRAARSTAANLRASLARTYPHGRLPAGHALTPHARWAPSNPPARRGFPDSPQWTWSAGGARECLSFRQPPLGTQPEPRQLGQEEARVCLAHTLPGAPKSRFAKPLDLSMSISALIDRGLIVTEPSFEFHKASGGRASPGPAAYGPYGSSFVARPRSPSVALHRPDDRDSWVKLSACARGSGTGPSPLGQSHWPVSAGTSWRVTNAPAGSLGSESREAGKTREGYYSKAWGGTGGGPRELARRTPSRPSSAAAVLKDPRTAMKRPSTAGAARRSPTSAAVE